MGRLLMLACFLLSTAMAGDALAAPKRPDGGTCDSTGTARRVGTDESGAKVDCLWDTCTYTECSTSGGQISNCVKKTTYSNARATVRPPRNASRPGSARRSAIGCSSGSSRR